MAAIANEIDRLLNASPAPEEPAAERLLLLACSSPKGFAVAEDGTATPGAITFDAVRFNLEGTASFSASNGATLTVIGDEASLDYVNMPGNSTTVTVSVTDVDGVLHEREIVIDKVFAAGTRFTWLRYADDINGTGISDDPTGKTYIGFATNKTTATESTNPADYTWSLIKGTDGQPAADKFIWIKYADYADGTGMYDVPHDDTVYIGIAVNKTTSAESTVKTDYVWSRFKGAQGVAGTGARGPGWFYAVGSAWNDTTAHAATPGDTQVDDTVTISDGNVSYTKRWNGSAWFVPGAFMDGSLFVEKSITAAKINANGLEIRDPQGNLILGAGSALRAGYEAPGTKNSELTPSIDSAATTATWGGVTGPGKPADNATVGADATNLKVGVGGRNLIPRNSLPASADYYYITDYGQNLGGQGAAYAGPGHSFSAYSLNEAGCVWVHVPGTPAYGSTIDLLRSDTFPIVPGQRYEFGVTLSTHRCVSTVKAFFYDVNGSYLSELTGGGIDNAWNASQAQTMTGIRSCVIENAPAAARSVRLGVRQVHDGRSDPYTFASQWYFGEAGSAQTVPSAWSESGGGLSGQYSSINSAIADKLSKTSASSLAASVTLVSGGSILAGDTTNGSYHSPDGFYGVRGGVVKFSVPVSGDPTFAGQLTAAYGSFGAVSIASGGSFSSGQTAYDTGSGWWMGYVGGVPKFSLGTAGGGALLWDGTDLIIRNPKQQTSFSATMASLTQNGLANTSTYASYSFKPTLSNGVAPYSYFYVFSLDEGDMKMTSSPTPSDGWAVIQSRGSNRQSRGYLTVTVTDANGAKATASCQISLGYGAY